MGHCHGPDRALDRVVVDRDACRRPRSGSARPSATARSGSPLRQSPRPGTLVSVISIQERRSSSSGAASAWRAWRRRSGGLPVIGASMAYRAAMRSQRLLRDRRAWPAAWMSWNLRRTWAQHAASCDTAESSYSPLNPA